MTTAITLCLGVPGASFAAAPTVTILPLNAPSDVVANTKRVFVSGGYSSTQVVVADVGGKITQTLENLSGPTDLQLSNDGKTLFVAQSKANEIVAYDTKTLRESARYPTGEATCPESLAYTGRFLWFGYGCYQSRADIGRIDLESQPATVTTGLSDRRFSYAPLLASALQNTDVLLVAEPGLSSAIATSYEISFDGALTFMGNNASLPTGSNAHDLAFSPSGKTAYMANGAPYRVTSFLMPTLTRKSRTYKTGPYPTAVDVSHDGTRIAGGADADDDPDVFVFDLDGAVLSKFELGGQYHRLVRSGLAWAPNGRKIYAISNDGIALEHPAQLHVLPVPAL